MQYTSTRSSFQKGFSDIVLDGLMPDGGLSVPEYVPSLSSSQLTSFAHLSYADLAAELIWPFVEGDTSYLESLTHEELKQILSITYQADSFQTEEITPVSSLGQSLYLLHVSNGPTLAFKDIAMQFLGHLFETLLAKTNRSINILGATSGDTGSAAEYAFKGKRNVRVFMLSPQGRMSAFQRAQMYSLQEPNIFNIAIDGVFDDCQDLVKQVNEDLVFKQRYQIGAVNSINWGRIVAQMVYYFKGFFALQAQGVSLENGMDVCVPSGNFGNIYAAYLASRMGLPIRRLVVATNENDVLDEFFKTGLYRPRSREQTIATSSPSMDISKASNFERYIYDWVGAERTQDLWRQLQQKGFFELKDKLPQIQKMMISGRSTHQDRLKTIRAVYEENRYILDPHTADGVFIAHSVVKDSTPILVVETALAVKFNSTIKEALGFDMAYPTHLRDLEQRPQRVKSLALDLLQLKSFLAGSIG